MYGIFNIKVLKYMYKPVQRLYIYRYNVPIKLAWPVSLVELRVCQGACTVHIKYQDS